MRRGAAAKAHCRQMYYRRQAAGGSGWPEWLCGPRCAGGCFSGQGNGLASAPGVTPSAQGVRKRIFVSRQVLRV